MSPANFTQEENRWATASPWRRKISPWISTIPVR